MKALVFAAGLGTRLQPLTNHTPKALVTVANKPLLQHCIERLKTFGYTQILVNVHHFSGQIVDFLAKNDDFGIEITVSDETELLLDTGGALKKAAWFFEPSDHFLIHNADIYSEIDLEALRQTHLDQKNMATLATNNRKSTRNLIFSPEKQLVGKKNENTYTWAHFEPKNYIPLAFGGIQMVSGYALAELPKDQNVFSVIDFYLKLTAKRLPVGYYDFGDQFWIDLGKKEHIETLEKHLKQP